MGQYHMVFNLDKQEYLHPHNLGAGLKSGEFGWPKMNTVGSAMIALMVCPEPRGGGDIEGDEAGRWHGDRVVIVGDYAEDGDFASDERLSHLWCHTNLSSPPACSFTENYGLPHCDAKQWADVSEMAAKIMKREWGFTLTGTGWKDVVDTRQES